MPQAEGHPVAATITSRKIASNSFLIRARLRLIARGAASHAKFTGNAKLLLQACFQSLAIQPMRWHGRQSNSNKITGSKKKANENTNNRTVTRTFVRRDYP